MSLIDEFDELKSGLKEKWLDYYEANQAWINSTGIHHAKGYNPNSYFVIGVVATLDPKATELIYFLSTRLGQNIDTITQTLGLAFDPIPVLKAREEEAKKLVQEAKLLTASGEDYTDPLLEELRREAREINNTSE